MSEPRAGPPSMDRRLPDPKRASNVLWNPSFAELRKFASHEEITTSFGAPAYVSTFRSRSADRTKNAIDHEFTRRDYDLIEAAVQATTDREMVCLDRLVGHHPDATFCCRYFVPREHARIALGWAKLLDPSDGREPDFQTVQIPDHDELGIRVLPEEGSTAVLGSDYIGEAKKSFLRMFMHRMKRQGGLGLHAGSKRVRVRDGSGGLRDVGQLFLGLSATGKSTLTSHSYWLESPENAVMVQDDVCALLSDGSVAGSEGDGLFIKTLGLDADEQPGLYGAATHESAVLENVAVDDDGTVHFDEPRYGKNGRAIVQRAQLENASEGIDLDTVDQVYFITRNRLMPPIAKLDATQAGATFMLGESIETSAGDPERAGEPIRVPGTNPFIIGSAGEEGNRFRDLVAAFDLDCFVLNTGHLGAEAKDIGVRTTVSILDAVARQHVEWKEDDRLGLRIPSEIPDLSIEAYYPPDHVPDYDAAIADFRTERRAYLEQFDQLDNEIKDAVY